MECERGAICGGWGCELSGAGAEFFEEGAR